jgi:hypothetical protein
MMLDPTQAETLIIKTIIGLVTQFFHFFGDKKARDANPITVVSDQSCQSKAWRAPTKTNGAAGELHSYFKPTAMMGIPSFTLISTILVKLY